MGYGDDSDPDWVVEDGPFGAVRRPRRTEAPTIWSATDLVAHDFPEPRWAVPGLVPEGLSLLVGSPKVGKSWVALGIAIAVAAGGHALGRVPVTAGAVLYLALEDTPRRLQARTLSLLGRSTAPSQLGIATEWPRFSAGGDEHLAKTIANTADIRLVIVDVLERIRPRTKGDRSYEADYAAAAALKTISDEAGVAVVAVHHTRKAASEDFVDEVSGTSGLTGAADNILVLKRQRGAADAVLRLVGRDIEDAELPLSFDGTTGGWTLLDGPAGDYELGDTRRRILGYLREHDWATPTLIADGLALTLDNAKQTLRRMANAGQIDTDGSGHYLLTPVTPVTGVTPPVTAVTGVTPPYGNDST